MLNHSVSPDRNFIQTALEQTDPMALRAVIGLLTTEQVIHDRLEAMPLAMTDFFLVRMLAPVNADDISWLKETALTLIEQQLSGGNNWPELPHGPQLQPLLKLATGNEIPIKNIPYWREELGIEPMPRQFNWQDKASPAKREKFRVIVIGSGYAGINAGIQLKDAGFDYSIIEKNAGVGGTWYQNHYPGARVDYPSRLYSYTYQSDYRWKHHFAPQQELQEYLNFIVDHYGIRQRIQFEQEVISAKWLEDEQLWQLSIRDQQGTVTTEHANAVISAVGLFDRPSVPDFKGIDSFKGPIFHPTQWDDTLDITDKHVAIVGSGATALQIAATVAKQAKNLTVFQRTPPWMVPWPGYDSEVSPHQQWLFDNLPYYLNWVRMRASYALGDDVLGQVFDVDPDWKADMSVNDFNETVRVRLTDYITNSLKDRPDLFEKCMPKYPPLSNRFVVDAGWYEALLNGSANLVAEGVDAITPDGIVSTSGLETKCDVIVLATGFRSNDFLWPMEITGRGGKTLQEAWSKDGGRAYLGMSVPDFPNLFMHYGPNSNPRAGTPPMWAEIQMKYILGIFDNLVSNNQNAVSTRQDVFDRHAEQADEILARSIWMDPRQKSYYTNKFGRVATNSPWKTIDYWHWLQTPNMSDYDIS